MNLIEKIYRTCSGWLMSRWLGSLQSSSVVRSLHVQHAIRLLSPETGKRFVDAGCGEDSPITAVLARRYPKDFFIATDLFFAFPLPAVPNLNHVIQNVKAPCFKQNSFDVLFTLDMLEHVENPKQVLKEISRWVKPGGVLFVHTPHKNHFFFFKRSQKPDHPSFRPVREGDIHVTEGFDGQEMKTWLEGFGFDVKKTAKTFGPLLSFFKELYTLGERKRLPGIGILLLPFIILLTWREIHFPPKKGNGLWVEAVRKPRAYYV